MATTNHNTLSGLDDHEEPKFDFNSPEDVLIEVVGPYDGNPDNRDWNNWDIETCIVIRGAEGVIGAASYEYGYGGFLNHTIEGMINCPGAGWFVVESVIGEYIKGDGWTTDDNMIFECKGVRPATEAEIALA
jgi:hypothetical protein